MRSIEPMDILTKAAVSTLGDYGRDLRERGWDAHLVIHADDAGRRRICLEVHLRMLVPVEVGDK